MRCTAARSVASRLTPSDDDEVAGLRLLRGCVQFPADHSPARRCIAWVGDRSHRILLRIRLRQIFGLRTEILSFLFIRS
jgi:hypothetical protein